MKYNILLTPVVIIFLGCSGKELKRYGGELALSGGGHPISVAVGVAVGGTLYGVGSLIDKEETSKEKEKDENK